MRSFKPETKSINIILMNGGVGDHMASLVAVNYILKKYIWVHPQIFVPDFLLEFARHVLQSKAVVKSYSAMKISYDRNKPTKTTEWDGHTSPMKIHCLDYAFLRLCDENPAIEYKNYLKIRPDEITAPALPPNYVVITTGYTAKVREFKAKRVNALTTYIKARGYEVVFLGQKSTATGSSHKIEGKFDEELDFSQGINLIDQTSLLQAAKIMHNSKAVLGVDNGLLHVAGCTDAPIIGGFTTVSPEIRMPVRNNILGHNYYPVTPDKTLNCSFCQEKSNFLYKHDYRNCLYKDFLCTDQMTAEKFIIHLDKILI